MSRIQIKLPCLYDKKFEEKASESITYFLDEKCSKQEDTDTIVRKAHDLTRRYFDSALIYNIVIKWQKDY
jgi:hypothetical protein